MKLMIDTNIILDVLLERVPSYAGSKAILNMCEKNDITGFISASTATDIFYLVRKALGSTDEAYNALGHILNIVKVLNVTNNDVNTAFLKRAKDFEDCLLATCANSNKCDGIVTRNKKDFADFGIALFSPEEIIGIKE
ncbi:MAG: PIN domain-containing protein [Lachnospiraceae bacterium]|nr:PIN domain-containing protein [Lachnospiraceae bacterium]